MQWCVNPDSVITRLTLTKIAISILIPRIEELNFMSLKFFITIKTGQILTLFIKHKKGFDIIIFAMRKFHVLKSFVYRVTIFDRSTEKRVELP